MPPVLSCLTAAYLNLQHSTKSWQTLQLEHLNAILRAHSGQKGGRLRNQPQFFDQGVAQICALEDLRVNWAYVVHSIGLPTRVDDKIKELFDNKIIALPEDQIFLLNHRPTVSPSPPPGSPPGSPPQNRSGRLDGNTDGNTDKPLDQNKEKDDTAAPPEDPRYPAHKFEFLHLDPEDETRRRCFNFVKFDPEVDFENWKPKIIVVNLLGEIPVATRFNAPQIKLYRFEEFDPAHISIGVDTHELLETCVLNGATNINPNAGFGVSWSIPGFDNQPPFGPFPIYTQHPEDTPNGKWLSDIDENNNHHLPALGAPNALRVILTVSPFSLPSPVPPPQTEAQRINLLLADYLFKRHNGETNTTILAIRKHNRNHVSKHKGTTPQLWIEWITNIRDILHTEKRVPPSHLDKNIRRKIISNTAIDAEDLLGSLECWSAPISRRSGDLATRAKSPLCRTIPATTICTNAGSKTTSYAPATPPHKQQGRYSLEGRILAALTRQARDARTIPSWFYTLTQTPRSIPAPSRSRRLARVQSAAAVCAWTKHHGSIPVVLAVRSSRCWIPTAAGLLQSRVRGRVSVGSSPQRFICEHVARRTIQWAELGRCTDLHDFEFGLRHPHAARTTAAGKSYCEVHLSLTQTFPRTQLLPRPSPASRRRLVPSPSRPVAVSSRRRLAGAQSRTQSPHSSPRSPNGGSLPRARSPAAWLLTTTPFNANTVPLEIGPPCPNVAHIHSKTSATCVPLTRNLARELRAPVSRCQCRTFAPRPHAHRLAHTPLAAGKSESRCTVSLAPTPPQINPCSVAHARTQTRANRCRDLPADEVPRVDPRGVSSVSISSQANPCSGGLGDSSLLHSRRNGGALPRARSPLAFFLTTTHRTVPVRPGSPPPAASPTVPPARRLARRPVFILPHHLLLRRPIFLAIKLCSDSCPPALLQGQLSPPHMAGNRCSDTHVEQLRRVDPRGRPFAGFAPQWDRCSPISAGVSPWVYPRGDSSVSIPLQVHPCGGTLTARNVLHSRRGGIAASDPQVRRCFLRPRAQAASPSPAPSRRRVLVHAGHLARAWTNYPGAILAVVSGRWYRCGGFARIHPRGDSSASTPLQADPCSGTPVDKAPRIEPRGAACADISPLGNLRSGVASALHARASLRGFIPAQGYLCVISPTHYRYISAPTSSH
ncbi:hypothetical protein C8R43DRAFT_1135399 [Mycena crocata]|nr:hypothetical protein C8R43DRAFT_1135399 [Mycena crocata]